MSRIFLILCWGSLIFSSCSVMQPKQSGTEKKTAASPATLQGTWVADYVLDTADLAQLYPEAKPEITIAGPSGGAVQGSSGCNRIAAQLKVAGGKMTFENPVALTRKFCPGMGEAAFLAALKRVNLYALSPKGDELTCIQGDIIVLRFLKK